MIKAYFIDLDGTTIDVKENGKKFISKENQEAIKKISTKALVVISTGRPNRDYQKEKEEMGIKYTIARNGAVICDKKGKILSHKPIDKEVGRGIVEFLKQNKSFTKINDIKAIYQKNIIARWISKKYNVKNISWNEYKEPKTFEKFLVLAGGKLKIKRIKRSIEERFPTVHVSTSGKGWVLEITDQKATKGLAALEILKWEKIDPKYAMHIGDSMNDSTAMDVLGYGVTFKNADKHLLKHATHIGPKHKKGGLAKIIDGQYKIIKKGNNDKDKN